MRHNYVRHLQNVEVKPLIEFIKGSRAPVYLGVYGTLRKEARAHGFLEGTEFVREETLGEYFRMISINGNFPAVIDVERGYHRGYEKSKSPLIELYSGITEELMHRLDGYEGFPHLYNREVLQVYDKGGNTTMFICLYTWAGAVQELEKYPMVVSGDWLKKDEEYEAPKLKKKETKSGIRYVNLNLNEMFETVQQPVPNEAERERQRLEAARAANQEQRMLRIRRAVLGME